MDILVTGSIAFDYLMRFPGKFQDAFIEGALDKISLSFLVDDMTRHFGGVAPNIAYTMALLGEKPRIMGAAGRDFGDYRRWLDEIGVDTSTVVVLEDVFTASFFANTDIENNQISSFYAGAMGRAGEFRIQDVTDKLPEWVVISPNAPQAMENLIEECIELRIPFVYDPSQQTPRLNGDELLHGIKNCKMLTVNEYEWEIIQNKAGVKLDDVLSEDTILILTKGKSGAEIHVNGELYFVPIFDVDEIVDPTGVGDAFRGGFFTGMSQGFAWETCGQIGSLAAAYALENTGTQNHHFTSREFVQRFRTQYDDHGALDEWLKLVTPD